MKFFRKFLKSFKSRGMLSGYPFNERMNIRSMIAVVDKSINAWQDCIELVTDFYRENNIAGKIVLIDFFSKKSERNKMPMVEGIYEFNRDSLDFFGRLKGEEFDALSKKEFDAMIVPGNRPCPALIYLISKSKAHFKVGRSCLGYNFDMVIDPPSEIGFSQADGARSIINFLFSIKWK